MARKVPRIAAIVLAAGRSTRFGAANKLLAEVDGAPIVRRVVNAALQSRARPVLVVTGHERAEVEAALTGVDVTLIFNSGYGTGLASSLRAGVRAVPAECEGAVVLLGDMPRIAAEHIDGLIAAFAADRIVVPVHGKERGNPVLWPARYFPELLQLQGDTGAKRLLGVHAAQVREIDLGTDAILADVDTPEALERQRNGR